MGKSERGQASGKASRPSRIVPTNVRPIRTLPYIVTPGTAAGFSALTVNVVTVNDPRDAMTGQAPGAISVNVATVTESPMTTGYASTSQSPPPPVMVTVPCMPQIVPAEFNSRK